MIECKEPRGIRPIQVFAQPSWMPTCHLHPSLPLRQRSGSCPHQHGIGHPHHSHQFDPRGERILADERSLKNKAAARKQESKGGIYGGIVWSAADCDGNCFPARSKLPSVVCVLAGGVLHGGLRWVAVCELRINMNSDPPTGAPVVAPWPTTGTRPQTAAAPPSAARSSVASPAAVAGALAAVDDPK